jgi:hypothetical protein
VLHGSDGFGCLAGLVFARNPSSAEFMILAEVAKALSVMLSGARLFPSKKKYSNSQRV